MTRFRPCIDIHDGQVKQIVGSSLSDSGGGLKTNFVSDRDPAWFAQTYQADGLTGGHVILLGPGNEAAAKSALAAYPGGLQVGGGIRPCNAAEYLEAGASHVIVTSYLFETDGTFSETRLQKMVAAAGRERLVIDLSCKASASGWTVAMNRWQTLTDLHVTPETLKHLASCCAEFLIHAVDVEGKCEGMDEALVPFLGEHSPIPMTYAGGIRHLEDLHRLDTLSHGRVDGTIGSALDMFGGTSARYEDCVAFNRR
ncbi:1-(5-phosphoribosyl)-5-[(5-phosphoribosylamino)methylideneamino] imidazole-4-carboxamide isomerase [Prosthecobacter fusiformis]|uniref:1-(5-phosphoribosyl)-5-[(5-phosphoribosylamino)methylideneamino] imidazole-4-carboxamide isomerase n=1 Tax=Prosthecobacter fusiformis TaxID=48464 RepID=A0A4R7RMP2_9BACT|nr:phosphoribosylformimino-5-aminoimidazole carboxamide ribotide isomerase [Prosthecobacter fusiformis]TDU66612.1 1-(5-phosphoribosyl)-5-[(5-phosphoribosylamino)methylideneamino] imidazole-4-carboxamide isomerase [Prosthecobacter fusiformis]